jgi:hypothetical protein
VTHLKSDVLRLIEDRNRRDDEEDFAAWCDELVALPENFEQQLKDGLKADIELQPARWLSLGLDLIESSKVTAHVQLSDGQQGPPLASFLPYPVFQMGTEIFLKGMWLCQFDSLRGLTARSYIDESTRDFYMARLGKKVPDHDLLGHDLLKLLNVLRKIPRYEADTASMRFLKIVDAIVRFYYFPFYRADIGPRRWANARYPKRFYDDNQRTGSADAFRTYPPQQWVARSFSQMKGDAHRLWDLPGG